MKKSTRNLIIIAVCIAALGGTTAVLSLSGGGSSSSSTASIELISKKSEDIASMQVTNQKGSYTLIPVTTKLSSKSSGSSSGPSDVTYTVKELTGVSVNTSETGSVIKNGFSLAATRNLGTVSSLGDYGLKNPKATVKVTFKDGSTFNYKIGNTTATDTSAYYMCGIDSSTVYIVAIDSGLLEDAKYFVNKEILSIGNSSGNNDFTGIKLSGTNYPQTVQISKKNSGLKITSPQEYDIDFSKLNSLQSELASLTAQTVEAVNPNAETLASYGLDKPCAVCEFTVNKGSYKLTAGKKDGNYYVMLGNTNTVYGVSQDSVTAWADSGLFGLRQKIILMKSTSAVKSITLTSGSTVNVINVKRTEKTSSKSSSSGSTPEYSYTVTGNNGKSLSYDSNFSNFYEKLAEITILENADNKPSGSPALTVEYTYFNSNDKDKIEFYDAGNRRYTAVLNGNVFGNVTVDDINSVNENIKTLESGGTISD